MKPDDSTRDVVRELLKRLLVLVPANRFDDAASIAREVDAVVAQEEDEGEQIARDLLDTLTELEELKEHSDA